MKTLIAIITLLLTTGCSIFKDKTIYVTQTKYLTSDIPTVLLQPCSTSIPPDKTEYLNSNTRQKETTLTSYIVNLHGDIAVCNKKLDGIRTMQSELKKKAEESNAKIIQ